MTFKELYHQAKNRKEAPGRSFIREVRQVTKKSEPTVRRWVCDGPTSCIPDALTQEVLAKHFNTTPEELFPRQ